MPEGPQITPAIRTVGVDGMLVSFGDSLSEPANRAALAFSEAILAEGWEGVEETSTSLVSAYVRFDPLHLDHAELLGRLRRLVTSRDWSRSELPRDRRLWTVPAVFGTDMAPQLDQAAAAAGLTPEEAIRSLTTTRVRVQTIGFAPGQPYLGELPECWDIPRQSQLTSRIPEGALVVAIRQLVLFAISAPTGWIHVAQTALRLFQADSDDPFLLRPGDEMQFTAVSPEALHNMRRDPLGGATSQGLS